MSRDPKKNARVDICDFEQVLNFFDESDVPNGLCIDSEPLSQDFLRECEELIKADQGRKEQLNENSKDRMTVVLSNSSLHGNSNDAQEPRKAHSMATADDTSWNNIPSNMNTGPTPMSPSLSKAFQKMNLAQSLENAQNVDNIQAGRTKTKSPAISTEIITSDVGANARYVVPGGK